MNGPVAQMAALVCHGNAFLQGLGTVDYFSRNSTCQFCEFVRFFEVKNPTSPTPVETALTPSPDDWFPLIKKGGAAGLRLICDPANRPNISDRKSAAYAGGGKIWTIEELRPEGRSRYWAQKMALGDQNAEGGRVWQMSYGRIGQGPASPPVLPDALPRAHAVLFATLREVLAFATVHEQLDPYSEYFSRAIETLSSNGQFLHAFSRDIAPEGFLQKGAVAVLDAVQTAFVFGGNSGWNDLAFDPDQQALYEEVSDKLFEAIAEATVAAVNTSLARGTV
jgi:hypothetical protein